MDQTSDGDPNSWRWRRRRRDDAQPAPPEDKVRLIHQESEYVMTVYTAANPPCNT